MKKQDILGMSLEKGLGGMWGQEEKLWMKVRIVIEVSRSQR